MDKFAGPFEVPSGRPARGRVTAPPSKSHAIRALVCAALGNDEGSILFRCGPIPDDILHAVEALRGLGFEIEQPGELELRVRGTSGIIPRPAATIDVGGSGTAFRFLAAVAALGAGPTTLTGDASLRGRPAGAIVPALQELGLSVTTERGPRGATAPITIVGGPPSMDSVEVDASTSSQDVSALLLIGPVLPRGITIRLRGAPVSGSYIHLTSMTMTGCGAEGAFRSENECYAEPGGYPQTARQVVGGDWSSAAFLFAAAAVTEGMVTIDGLAWGEGQPDDSVLDFFDEDHFGGGSDISHGFPPELAEETTSWITVVGNANRRPLDVDLGWSPDLAPLVGALGCVASGTTRVRGAAHLRIKESDRIAAVVAAARALGCEARELPDGFEIDGPAKHGGLVETRHDHRIAMAFAVAGLAIPGVVIDDPACVAKSYPGFWDDLARLTGG